MKSLLAKTIVLGAFALCAASTQAAVLTWGTITTSSQNDIVQQMGTSGSFAIGFTATADEFLSSASFDLVRSSGGNRNVRLRIFAGGMTDTGFNAGNTASFISGNIAPGGAGNLTTFSGINLALTAGQTYWMVIDANTTTGGAGIGTIDAFSATGTDTVSGASTLSFLGARNSTTADSFGTTTSSAFAADSIPNFSVTVPEPHEYAMVAGLGLCAFAAYRRRNARVTA